MITCCILARKGGAGKTALAVNLATLLAKKRKTLLIDLDEQGTATGILGIDAKENVAHALEAGRAKPVKTDWGFDLLPSGPGLYQVAAGMSADFDKYAGLLEDVLKGLDYELAIIDTAPSISALTINALVAADFVLIPVNTGGREGLQGLAQTVQMLETARAGYSGRITAKIAGIVPNMSQSRTRTHKAVLKRLKADYGNLLLPPIPHSVKVGEAGILNKPLVAYAPNSKPAKAYGIISKQVIKLTK